MIGIRNTKKKGFTLVETLVAIGLFSIISAIAIGGFVHALHTQKEVAGLIASQSTVSLAIEQMAREIRTGYLFCHANDGKGLNSPPLAVCGCVNVLSPPNPPNSWACQSLQYYNAQSEQVTYALSDGTLVRADSAQNSQGAQPLTGDDVTVRYLSFRLFGQLEGDHWPPRITILLGISPSSTDPTVANDILNFQTTVSARQIDCVPGSDPPSC